MLLVFARTHHLLQDKHFVRVWLTGAICNTVRWLEFLAMGMFVFQMTGSAFDVSIVAAVRLLPLLFFGTLTGAIADRVNRSRLLAGSLIFLIAIFSTLGILASLGELRLTHINIASFLSGLVLSGEHSVRRALLGEISGVKSLAAANGLDRSTDNITLIAGPLIGGLLFQTIGLIGTCAVACIMLGIALGLIVGVPSKPQLTDAPPVSLFFDIRQALKFALATPAILRVLITTIIFNFCVWPLWALMPIIAATQLHLDPLWTGLLMSTTGIGSLAGALCVIGYVRPRHYQPTFFFSSLLFLFAIALFSVSNSLWGSCIIFFAAGLGLSGFAILQTTIILSVSPRHTRSTIMGVVVMCIGTSPAGIASGGFLADQIGVPNALLLIALTGLIGMCLTRIIVR